MSRPTKNASTALATFWPCNAIDEFGRKTYSAPVLVSCAIETGKTKKYTTSKGVEIVPLMSVWFEFNGFTPKDGDMMLKGNFTTAADPVSVGALPVKDVTIHDCSFLRQIDDVMVVL